MQKQNQFWLDANSSALSSPAQSDLQNNKLIPLDEPALSSENHHHLVPSQTPTFNEAPAFDTLEETSLFCNQKVRKTTSSKKDDFVSGEIGEDEDIYFQPIPPSPFLYDEEEDLYESDEDNPFLLNVNFSELVPLASSIGSEGMNKSDAHWMDSNFHRSESFASAVLSEYTQELDETNDSFDFLSFGEEIGDYRTNNKVQIVEKLKNGQNGHYSQMNFNFEFNEMNPSYFDGERMGDLDCNNESYTFPYEQNRQRVASSRKRIASGGAIDSVSNNKITRRCPSLDNNEQYNRYTNFPPNAKKYISGNLTSKLPSDTSSQVMPGSLINTDDRIGLPVMNSYLDENGIFRSQFHGRHKAHGFEDIDKSCWGPGNSNISSFENSANKSNTIGYPLQTYRSSETPTPTVNDPTESYISNSISCATLSTTTECYPGTQAVPILTRNTIGKRAGLHGNNNIADSINSNKSRRFSETFISNDIPMYKVSIPTSGDKNEIRAGNFVSGQVPFPTYSSTITNNPESHTHDCTSNQTSRGIPNNTTRGPSMILESNHQSNLIVNDILRVNPVTPVSNKEFISTKGFPYETQWENIFLTLISNNTNECAPDILKCNSVSNALVSNTVRRDTDVGVSGIAEGSISDVPVPMFGNTTVSHSENILPNAFTSVKTDIAVEETIARDNPRNPAIVHTTGGPSKIHASKDVSKVTKTLETFDTIPNSPCGSGGCTDDPALKNAYHECLRTGKQTLLIKEVIKRKIMYKRCIQGIQEVPSEPSLSSSSCQLTEEEVNKNKRRRELNRIAAANLRKRQKVKQQELSSEEKFEKDRQSTLLAKVEKLEMEKVTLLSNLGICNTLSIPLT